LYLGDKISLWTKYAPNIENEMVKKKAKKKKQPTAKSTSKKTPIKEISFKIIKISSDKTCFNCNKTIKNGATVYKADGKHIHLECPIVSREDAYKLPLSPVKRGRTKQSKLSVQSPLFNAKIVASPDGWKSLHSSFLYNREGFAQTIYNEFIYPALKDIKATPERGMHKGRTAFTKEIKENSAWLYCFVRYWIDNPDKNPSIFKKALNRLKQDESLAKKPQHFFRNPRAVTMSIMKRFYGVPEKEHKKNWKDPDNFYHAYLVTTNNPYLKDIRKKFNTLIEHNPPILPREIINILSICS